MTDWKTLAKAKGIPWDDQAASRHVALLEALEAAFAPLAAEVAPDTEPAPVFHPEGGKGPQ